MSAENFIIYRSSAGSGKTYTLTKEYLKLALKNTYYYKYILAVTFTNKAMQEMKNRIIQKLHEFSEGQMDGMAEELMQHSGLDENAFQLRCRAILVGILHGYSHFSISTIDAFFQKVIRSFAKELGLAGSYRLELDFELILIQIVDDLLLEVTENKQIREWIIRFARENLQEGNNWDVRKNIKDLAKELFNENFKRIEDEIAGHDRSLIKKLKASVDEIIAVFENKMHALGCEGLDMLEKNGLDITDFSYGKSGAMGHLSKICKQNKNYEPGKRLTSALESGGWYKKTSKKGDLIESVLAMGLEDVLNQSVTYYEKQFAAYSTALQIKKFLYGYGLLSDLTRKLQEYKKENDVMLISDATRFLKELVQDADTPFVYEKVGSFYRHYLIDEFQDTSGFQWDSFKPLVDDSLAQGYKNLVVGDIKQSIYRWRGGDWELLLSKIENDIGSNRTDNRVLDTNFRSAANVIQFNNSLFKLIPKVLMQAGGSDEDPAWQVLDKVYEDTYQNIPSHKSGNPQGYVNITFHKDEEDDKWKEKVSRQLPAIIEELQDKGVPLKETAILVRRNSEGKDVADYLSDYEQSGLAKAGYRYDVVSNESLFLSASPAVRVVISALRYMHDQKDKVVKAQLVYEYQKAIKNSEESLSHLFQSVSRGEFEKWLPALFFSQRTYLLHLPFYELVENLINIFEVNKIPGQFAYLQTFQDLMLKFSQNEKGDVFSFLEWWDERASKESIKVADDLDAIRILTIHKSKGLEYTSVIVPFCDWEIDHQRSPIIWTATDKEPFNIGHLPLKYKKDLANTFYQQDYDEEKIKAHLDNLNVLYVAFTRAAHNLWVMAPDNKKNIAKVLGETLDHGNFELKESWDVQKNVFEYGNREFKFEVEEEKPSPAVTLKSYQHFDWRTKITVKQSGNEFTEEDERRVKINYGILIHKLLSKIQVLEDKDKALEALYYEEGLNQEQKQEIETLLNKLLANQKAKAWYDQGWKVYNEMPIISPEAEYRLDRVVIKDKEAIIIDYKTGLPKKNDQQQMLNYKTLLSEMGYEKVQGFLWYLAEDDVVEVL
ncbi:UvrD-helicase domain-containing protein [Fulvivirga ligni]|uniref:UvrD-helicase domain-containing protein n=1 Tax=Fulvivirga ligni TaxID=2904246 RepID=UPI001F31ADD5|nr:UvrD-helicase domain-containing protein [Fulvivirga ligni]UII20366.1 UvrD-helicase domain-containing protein [Fulvivirga ligni]